MANRDKKNAQPLNHKSRNHGEYLYSKNTKAKRTRSYLWGISTKNKKEFEACLETI